MSEQLKKLTNPDTLVSLFLGLSVFIVAAIMVTNIIGARKNDKATQEKKANEQQVQNQQKLPATYTVVSGDTLWGIAEKTIGSGYNYVDIAAANKLSDANSISEGQKLSIPNVAKKEPGQVSSASVTVNKPADGKYTVKKGDSLWSISESVYGTGYRWSEIAAANKLANPGLIFSGDVLQLP